MNFFWFLALDIYSLALRGVNPFLSQILYSLPSPVCLSGEGAPSLKGTQSTH